MSQSLKQDSEVLVTFTGGLGAQILSAAIYYYFKGKGRKVYADKDYFKQPGRTATPGNKGEVSQWNYELGEYGLSLEGFSTEKVDKSFFRRNRLLLFQVRQKCIRR